MPDVPTGGRATTGRSARVRSAATGSIDGISALARRIQRLIWGSITAERRREAGDDLRLASVLGRDFLYLVCLSCIIATFGLVLNSAAVIIGAMLVAPLMSPILALALAVVRGDVRLMGTSLLSIVIGAGLAIGLSALLGQLVSASPINLLEELPSEILGRTRPTLFDLAVALAGGAMAAYALARPRLSATLPGVAIATALMPPVCVVGIGLSQERADVAVGALVLFLDNFVAIVFGSSLVFVGLGFGPRENGKGWTEALGPILISGGLLLVMIAPLTLFMRQIVEDLRETAAIRDTLIHELALLDGSSLVAFDRKTADDVLSLTATVRSGRALAPQDVIHIQRQVATRIDRTVALRLLIVPVTALDPFIPPTRTPTIVPTAAPPPFGGLLGIVAPQPSTATVVPRASPSASPGSPVPGSPVPGSPVPGSPVPSSPSISTPIATLAPALTATPTPTSTAVPSPTLVPAPPTVAPPQFAVVGGTGGTGVNLRRLPGQTAVVLGLPDGTILQLAGRRENLDGVVWVEVISPNGLVGWIAEPYLVPFREYLAP